jgi:hypothetical protein
MMRRWWLSLVLWLALTGSALAAPYGPFNRPGDRWRVIETRHFRIYYNDETRLSAARIAEIADATFERLNAGYGFAPSDKIGVNLVGYTAYSNGFAEPQRLRITLFTTPANFHARNRAPWLENVFSHELSHILSLNAASPWSPRVPLVLGTGVARSAETQGLLRLPLFAGNHPHWFSEGVAQFDTEIVGRDRFDESRTAFERAALEDGLYYSLDRLAFSGDEKWYNTGFAFLRYLERRFGVGTVHRIFRRAGERFDLVFAAVFEDVLGVPLDELERDFRAELDASFQHQLARAGGGRHDGVRIATADEDPPFESLLPVERERLRDRYTGRVLRSYGERLFYRRGEAIHHARFDPKASRFEDDQVLGTGLALSRHTSSTFFVLRQEGHDPNAGSLYRPDFESPVLLLIDTDGNQRRLLEESRLLDLDVCPSRKELAAIHNDGDGSLRLALYPLEKFGTAEVRVSSERVRFPLPHQYFDEVRSPRYSPDCSKLFFSRRIGDDHGVYYWDFARARLETFVDEETFELYPEPAANGVYFSSARDGSYSVYFRGYDRGNLVRVSSAVTAHHYPVKTADGVVFARLRGSGFHPYYLADARASGERIAALDVKTDTALRNRPPPQPKNSRDYSGFSAGNWTPPSLVPLLDVEYDYSSLPGQSDLRLQLGLELYLEDQLRTQALWLRGFVGNRNNVFVSYRNEMTELSLETRAGYSQDRGVLTFPRGDGQVFEHVTDGRWGFLSGTASLQFDYFTRTGIYAETLRDIGTTLSAQARDWNFARPRYGRDQLGMYLTYSGIDRSDPAFREHWINKRGYREFDLRAAYAVEEVHASLAQYGLDGGRKPYLHAEFDHREYLALPTLARGAFDHTLELNLKLGAISRDIQFLPYYGGGRLYSQTTPELNTSVGFSGYGSYGLSGETLVNLSASYRFPLFRNLSLDWGPFYLEDVYAQIFTSWGNIWGFAADGSRMRPFYDRAQNGRFVLGDVGADLRLLSFFQEVESNMGTTLRLVYRAVPFQTCPTGPNDPSCVINGRRGLMGYLMIGAGF